MKEKINPVNQKINKIESTNEVLTGRGGLALFVRYLTQIKIYGIIFSFFNIIRKSKKGKSITNIFKQILCYFADGTYQNISGFNRLKEDEGYASTIENRKEDMCSSSMIRRFFKAFKFHMIWFFRPILGKLFIWRLNKTMPKVIKLMIDTMVMNNNDAVKRQGVSSTYKKVKGFQPLQLIWGNFIVDAIFRGGSRPGNSSTGVENMIKKAVQLIRKHYSKEAPIIFRVDGGFFDQKLLKLCDELGVIIICVGKWYEDTKETVEAMRRAELIGTYEKNGKKWNYFEFGYRYGTWNKFYRAVYAELEVEDGQYVLEFARTKRIIITNAGMNSELFHDLTEKEIEKICDASAIIESDHQRGKGELCHRGLKEFGHEQLPFEKFIPNAAYYYCMAIAFFLFEAFKEDVGDEIISIGSYANTVRRTIFDIAGKIVFKANQFVLKLTTAVLERLNFMHLWDLANKAIPIQT